MNKYWVWFSRLNKIGVKFQNELLEKYKTPEKIWNLKEKDVENILTKEQIKILLDSEYRRNLDKYIEFMKNNSIKMITINSKEYPQKLLNIYDPPVVLYVKGNESILNNLGIAIIGSRNCTEYGKNIAGKFAYNLAKKNINVISGLARGIDTGAHLGTVNANEKTIAILGSGIDEIYPSENYKLSEEIIKNDGAIVSEYIVGTKPEKMNFPARNRIISALADGILVVEASKKSGSLITVDFALEYGKNIYAIPRRYKQKQLIWYE